MASYTPGGVLLGSGASLIAVTALMVSRVTFGIVQHPAEALTQGTRFAIYRNLICSNGPTVGQSWAKAFLSVK
ncbi:MAG: hypothetical protein L0Z73_12545 [Gammaproteobacteria bacterium]|nr:hypothetical protein [Gammaproteobacteria bacterium]